MCPCFGKVLKDLVELETISGPLTFSASERQFVNFVLSIVLNHSRG